MKRVLNYAALTMIAACLAASDQSVSNNNRRVGQPWLGMSVRSHRDQSAKRFLHVERTVPGGPAERAEIRAGDIITMMAGASLDYGDDLDFLTFIANRKPGERLPFRIVRGGRTIDVVVIVGIMPESAREAWIRTIQAARLGRVAAQQRPQ